jgi:hypothetical protein
MMEGEVLFATEKVFSDMLGAKVTANVAANQVTVENATPS